MNGRVERFREELQIALKSIATAQGADADPDAFLPSAYRDLDELEGFLEHLAREVYDPGLKGLLGAMLADAKLRAEIRRAPCSLPASPSAPAGRGQAGHHAYLGGLLEHTVAVATLALELCRCTRAGPRPAAERGDRARPRQDARVHLWRRRSSAAARAACSATWSWDCG